MWDINNSLPCPFCGKKVDPSDSDTLYPTGTVYRDIDGIRRYFKWKDRLPTDGIVWGMNCPESSGGCGVELHADTRQKALDKWNQRTERTNDDS